MYNLQRHEGDDALVKMSGEWLLEGWRFFDILSLIDILIILLLAL